MSDLLQRFERLKEPRTTTLGPDANLPGTGSNQRRGAEGGSAETPPSANSGPATDPRSEAIAELLAKANALMNSAAAFVKYYEEPTIRKMPFKQIIYLCQNRISKLEKLLAQTLRYDELKDESRQISRAIEIFSAIIVEVGMKNSAQEREATAAAAPPPKRYDDFNADLPDNTTKLYGLRSQLVSLVRRMSQPNLPDIEQHSQRVAGIKEIGRAHV